MQIAKLAQNKKAINTEVIDVSKIASFTQYLVITSGDSSPQIKAVCRSIDEGLQKVGYKKTKWEGKLESNWMILDIGSVVVHVMSPEERKKYGLEELWGKTALTYHL